MATYDNQWDVGGAVNFTVFDASAWTRYRQASEGVNARKAAYDYQLKAVMNAAKKLYYQLLLLNEVVKVKEASEKRPRTTTTTLRQSSRRHFRPSSMPSWLKLRGKGRFPELTEPEAKPRLALARLQTARGDSRRRRRVAARRAWSISGKDARAVSVG